MPIKHISSDSAFDNALRQVGSTPVCVDFFAEWCGPCKMIAPFFEQLSNKYPSVLFLKVDVDQCTGASGRFGVSAMPTFLMVINGTKKDMVRGADSSALESMVRKYASGSAGSASSAFAEVNTSFPEAPSLWSTANERLRGLGVPSLTLSGFVFEPASLALALLSLLLYGPFGPLVVLGVTALAQTSASPFERYTPSTGAPVPSGAGGQSTGASPSPQPSTSAFSGSGRRLGD